ncbi:DHA2 family efflux MFS transporter permease subunit [Planosporangium thailandense]|uniref:DHA2 family efflux MFS transporter permease subunit n=1 Tax=Planosporangium thailandense TaxID=765197 RepID=A0ABX0XVH4_9ACTN|nr:DHA2 family efflux MFS transporter permease subunit [Planosporangium thailandense]NJC69892.1 DHA2 family efflux MFS transporter permease subunit [Planosporangium thailandense]
MADSGAAPAPVHQRTAGAPTVEFGTARGRWVLLATILGSGMAAIDATVVGIALPAIGRDFRAGLSSLQWMVTGYMLTLAGLLLVGGALGDRYGRRRVFVAGAVWFAAASLLCGLAPTAGLLIAARAVQGAGAALLVPSSLAAIEATFMPTDRARAIGAWSGFGGVATAVGPFVGGWLITSVSWRYIFLINLPLAVLVVIICMWQLPETRDESATGSIDLLGGAVVTLALVGLCFGLTEGARLGWRSPAVAGSLIAGVLLLAAFVLRERSVPDPLLPLSLFTSRRFSATNTVTFIVYGALGAILFLLPIQLQQVSGYSPLESGLALLPVTVIMLVLSARSGALAARIGPRLQMSVGPIVVAAGMILYTRIGAGGTYLTEVLPAVVVFGLGLAATVAPLTATALSSVPSGHAGIGSAVNNDLSRMGGLIAIAVLPTAAGIGELTYLHPDAFAAKFRSACYIAAAVCALGGLLAAATLGGGNPPAPEPVPVPSGTQPIPDFHCGLDAPPLQCQTPARPAASGRT